MRKVSGSPTNIPGTHAGALAKELEQFYNDPLGYVMLAFPWDTDTAIRIVKLAEGPDDRAEAAALAEGREVPAKRMSSADLERQAMYRARFPSCEFGPDLWACDFLTELQEQILQQNFDGRHAVDPIVPIGVRARVERVVFVGGKPQRDQRDEDERVGNGFAGQQVRHRPFENPKALRRGEREVQLRSLTRLDLGFRRLNLVASLRRVHLVVAHSQALELVSSLFIGPSR